MPRGHSRVALLAALHFLIICLLSSTTTSSSMAIESLVADAPSATEIALFEELVEWIGDEKPVAEKPLRRTIRARAASFDVFLSYLDDETRHERLGSVPFGEVIRQTAQNHGVDALLVAAIIEVESSFDPCAISRSGAVGLMQVMPATAGNMSLEDLSDPVLNIDYGYGLPTSSDESLRRRSGVDLGGLQRGASECSPLWRVAAVSRNSPLCGEGARRLRGPSSRGLAH